MEARDYRDIDYFTWEHEKVAYFGYWDPSREHLATASPQYKRFQREQVENLQPAKIIRATDELTEELEETKFDNEILPIVAECLLRYKDAVPMNLSEL